MRLRRLASVLLCVVATAGAPAGNVECGASEAGRDSASLRCDAAGDFVSKVTFASFGTPTGTCPFSRGDCHSNTSLAFVHAACYGQPSCTVPFYAFKDFDPAINKTNGGVCDMTLLAWFRNEVSASKVKAVSVCDMCHMSTRMEARGVFDHILAFTLPAFRFEAAVSPLPFFEFGGKQIPLKSLHFQGRSKHLLRNCKEKHEKHSEHKARR